MEQTQSRMVFLGNYQILAEMVSESYPAHKLTHMSSWLSNNCFWGLPQGDTIMPTSEYLRNSFLGLYRYEILPLEDDIPVQRKLIYSLWLNEGKALWENGNLISLHQFHNLIRFFPEKIQEELMQAMYSDDFSLYEENR